MKNIRMHWANLQHLRRGRFTPVCCCPSGIDRAWAPAPPCARTTGAGQGGHGGVGEARAATAQRGTGEPDR